MEDRKDGGTSKSCTDANFKEGKAHVSAFFELYKTLHLWDSCNRDLKMRTRNIILGPWTGGPVPCTKDAPLPPPASRMARRLWAAGGRREGPSSGARPAEENGDALGAKTKIPNTPAESSLP
jgi:hypothetical protein